MTAFKRKIFYLGGFDPRGARFYHALAEEQVAAHNAAGGLPEGKLVLGERRRAGGDFVWDLHDGAGHLAAECEFLVWDDLVRANWVAHRLAVLVRGALAYAHTLPALDWGLARRCPKGSRKALLWPGLAYLVAPALVVLVLGLALGWLVPWWLAGALALAGGALAARVLLSKLPSLWLLRFIIFNDALARRCADSRLADRLDHFADRIDQALGEGWDEVLLITHSNGSILSVPLTARLLDRHAQRLPGHFALVTLGSCIQLVAARRDAAWYHALLDQLAAADFRWLDIASITDGACIAQTPLCLGRPVEDPPGAVQVSPRWFRYCDPAKYEARRRDKYQTHFDYLRRLDRPSALDYIGLIAAARPLAASIDAFKAEQA